MIKVEVKDPDAYKDWYLDNVFSKLRDRITKTMTVFRSQLALHIMPNLADEQTLKDILTMHPHDLEKKYKWIYAYSVFVRNVDAKRGDPANKYCLEELEKFNKDISNYLNYEFLDRFFKGLRPELVRRIGVKVCPYCNQQYVNYIEDDRYNGYLGDLDHIRPKSLYPFFSMSLYNLIPVCKPCNQLFKKAKTTQFFNPYERGFGDDVSLYIKYKNVRQIVGLEEVDDLEWWIDPACSADEKVLFQNEIQLFKLDGVYRSHKKEIQIALKKRDEYTKRFLRLVYSRLPLGLLMDYRLEYGVSFDKDKYQDEMMSKAINDVVFKN
ncbi:HNH endonuclease [Butyrivibrio fibrisolvens]|uniref:HNH endonuclease signature motif containing protein n=1 Tax=Butyrivibrio fibrisolvens TaxID=831 RepID=UPI0003B495AF|nr:HNH endonuclease [Butyrivibrio fibrisolvens]